MLRRALLLVAAAAACTDPLALEPNTCGNLVLEAGEDCDAPSGCTAACQFACEPGTAAATCPDGASCGADGACRFPSGQLEARVSAPYGMYGFAVADIDGDHADDVMGVSAGRVVAAYGSPTEPLARHVLRPGILDAAVSVGDFVGGPGGDGRPDIVFTTAKGVYAFATTTEVPEALSFPFDIAQDVHLRSFPLPQAEDGTGYLDTQSDTLVIQWRSANGPQRRYPCELDDSKQPTVRWESSRLLGRTIHTFGPVVVFALAPTDVAACFGGARHACGHICIEAMVPDAPRPQSIPLPALPADTEVFFAELAGDATCPELAVPTVTQNGVFTYVALGVAAPSGGCTLNLTANTPLLAGAPLDTIQIDGATHVVTSAGIYHPPTGANVLPSPRPWRHAAVGDFDGNMRQDIAAIGFTGGVDVLEQQDGGAWRSSRIPTLGGFLDAVQVGDFDGDGRGDVAYAQYDNLGELRASLHVSHRDDATFGTPIQIVSLPGFRGMRSAALADPTISPTFDLYDDLEVVHDGYAGMAVSGLATRFYGAAERRMHAPWVLDPPFELRGSLVGPYGPDGESTIMALVSDPTGVSDIPFFTQLHYGQHTLQRGGDISAVGLAGLDLLFPLGAARPGTVLALRSGPPDATRCAAVIDTARAAVAPLTCAELTDETDLARLAGWTNAEVVVDELGTHLVVVRNERLGPTIEESHVDRWKLDFIDGRPRLTEPVAISELVEAALERDIFYCTDVAALELGARAGVGRGREIAMACHHRGTEASDTRVSILVHFAADGDGPGAARAHHIEELLPEIVSGDINGDGLDDIVYSGLTGSLGALLQRPCTAADEEGCR